MTKIEALKEQLTELDGIIGEFEAAGPTASFFEEIWHTRAKRERCALEERLHLEQPKGWRADILRPGGTA